MTSGFIKIPRSLLTDDSWKSLPYTYRHVFLTILEHVSFKETTQDDFGVNVKVKPGQLLITQRRLEELCNEPDIDRSLIQRAYKKFFQLGFSIQETIHKKTLITITRTDICELIDPKFNPNSIQTRSIKEECKERKEDKRPPTNQSLPSKVVGMEVGQSSGPVGGFFGDEEHKATGTDPISLTPRSSKPTSDNREIVNYQQHTHFCLISFPEISQEDKLRISSYPSELIQQVARFLKSPGFKLKQTWDKAFFYYLDNPAFMKKSKEQMIKDKQVKKDNQEFIISKRIKICEKIPAEMVKLLPADRDSRTRFRVNCECVEISNDRISEKAFFNSKTFKDDVIHKMRKCDLPIPGLIHSMA